MYISLQDVLMLTLIAVAGYYWWLALRVRELALQRAQQHCRELGLQLLDQSVALRGLWLQRDGQDRLRLWRRYGFEFSANGEDRYPGTIILLGIRTLSIELAPHRLAE